MNLYLIIFTAGTYKVEQVYEKHKDLFVELEKHFTLHLVNYTDSESIPSHEYKMAFIASGGVESAVVRFFSILPYPITLLTDGLNNSLAAALEISAWIQSRDMKVKIIHGSVPNMVNLDKFSYISKFHILISYKLTIYIVMCFYQGTN